MYRVIVDGISKGRMTREQVVPFLAALPDWKVARVESPAMMKRYTPYGEEWYSDYVDVNFHDLDAYRAAHKCR